MEMRDLLGNMIEDYNTYSQLVAFNLRYGSDEGTLQWNKASMKYAEDYMERLAKILGVKLEYVFSNGGGLSFEYLTVKEV